MLTFTHPLGSICPYVQIYIATAKGEDMNPVQIEGISRIGLLACLFACWGIFYYSFLLANAEHKFRIFLLLFFSVPLWIIALYLSNFCGYDNIIGGTVMLILSVCWIYLKIFFPKRAETKTRPTKNDSFPIESLMRPNKNITK